MRKNERHPKIISNLKFGHVHKHNFFKKMTSEKNQNNFYHQSMTRINNYQ